MWIVLEQHAGPDRRHLVEDFGWDAKDALATEDVMPFEEQDIRLAPFAFDQSARLDRLRVEIAQRP